MMPLDRRLFVRGLLASVALPMVARGDGVTFTFAAHPLSAQAVAADLNEESLKRLWLEIHGFDAFGNPIKEVMEVKNGLSVQSRNAFHQVTSIASVPIFMSWGQ